VWGFTPKGEFSFGGTYAHHIDGAIAFGIGAPDVDMLLHKANEFLPLEDLDRQVELCALTIAQLCEENPL
jgi:acetylornithine deacetylase/succinyl-diaminopimelate desuccinylase-like protein